MTPVEQAQALYVGCSDPTWRGRADWVNTNCTQEMIYQTNVALYKALLKIDLEGPEADAVRNECEIFWFALDEDHIKRLEEHLAKEKLP
jgi:hypothetical protein